MHNVYIQSYGISPHRVAEHLLIYLNTLAPLQPTSHYRQSLKSTELITILNIKMELLKIFLIFGLVASSSCYSDNYGEFELYADDAFYSPQYILVITYFN